MTETSVLHLFHRILGRRDHLILRGTLNISPLEVESAIPVHPAVAD